MNYCEVGKPRFHFSTAAGETADIAEEMAARDSLRRLYRFDDSSRPFPYGKALDRLIPLVIEDHVHKRSLPS